MQKAEKGDEKAFSYPPPSTEIRGEGSIAHPGLGLDLCQVGPAPIQRVLRRCGPPGLSKETLDPTDLVPGFLLAPSSKENLKRTLQLGLQNLNLLVGSEFKCREEDLIIKAATANTCVL